MAVHFVVNVDVMELDVMLHCWVSIEHAKIILRYPRNLIMIHLFFFVLCENQDLLERVSKVERHRWDPADQSFLQVTCVGWQNGSIWKDSCSQD